MKELNCFHWKSDLLFFFFSCRCRDLQCLIPSIEKNSGHIYYPEHIIFASFISCAVWMFKLVLIMVMNSAARALASILKARGLTAFGVVNTHESSSKAEKAVTPVRRGWNGGRGSLSVQMLVVMERISDTAEVETKGSQSAVREHSISS